MLRQRRKAVNINKKTVILLLLLTGTLILTGCSPAEDVDVEIESYEESIYEELSSDVPVTFVTVTKEEGVFSLAISIGTYGDIASFGNYILATRNVFEETFSDELRGNYSVSMSIGGTPPSLIRFSGDDYSNETDSLSGTLSDNRSGEVIFTNISDIEDIFESFPAAQLYAEEKGVEE